MTNELPDKIVARGVGNIDPRQEEMERVGACSEQGHGSEPVEDGAGQADEWDSKRSDVRNRSRTRYLRGRVPANSKRRTQGHEESRDLPLRQRMKIYRNRRQSR
ncbi:MAG: hypothetical protein OXI60_05650 [Acidiferrobacterales bacterium]|nr:hypothetical protein [Acidiferrobacterales bacterium]